MADATRPRERRRPGPLQALVQVELRRAIPPVRGGLTFAAVGTLGLLLLAPERRDLVAFPGAAAGIGFVLTVGMGGLRDRMDGSLSFVQSLPVEPGVAALARVVAVALVSSLSGALLATAVWIARPTLPPELVLPGGYAAVGIGCWLLSTALGSVVAGILLRFQQRTLGLLPPVLMTLLLVVSLLAERLPVGSDLARETLRASWLPPVLATIAWGFVIGGTWLGHRLLTAGIRDFRPARDRIEW